MNPLPHENHPDPGSRRPVLLALGSPLDNSYSTEFWHGLHIGARRRGADLVYLAGGIQRCYFDGIPPESPPNENRSTLLYQLFDTGAFDGVVLWGAQMLHDSHPRDLERLVGSFSGRPVLSVGWEQPGILSIMPDNYRAMKELTAHLIHVHGHRRIAYLATHTTEPSWEAGERHRAYTDALTEAGIEPDPGLIVTGEDIAGEIDRFEAAESWAALALHALIDTRGLRPGIDFTALAARDDAAALRAIAELTERGFSVPGDVAVVGFDDIPAGACAVPSLSTATQSFVEQGIIAVDTILARIAESDSIRGPGADSTDPSADSASSVSWKSRVILRESCGCGNPMIRLIEHRTPLSSAPAARWPGDTARAFSAVVEEFRHAYTASDAGARENDGSAHADPNPGPADPENRDNRDAASTLSVSVRGLIALLAEQGIDPWELVESALVFEGIGAEGARELRALAEDLVHRRLIQNEILHVKRNFAAGRIQRHIFTSYDLRTVLDGLEAQLPELEARGCSLVLFDEPKNPGVGAKLVFHFQDGIREPIDPARGIAFEPRLILPGGILPGPRPRSLHIDLIRFAHERLGYLILEPETGTVAVTSDIAANLSGSIKGSVLVGELTRANRDIEKLAREDAVTGLINRRTFGEILKDECRRTSARLHDGRTSLLLFLDLDHFKLFNDSWGHAAGDEILAAFADILRVHSGLSDRPCRFGGDEFCLLLRDSSPAEAMDRAHDIIAAAIAEGERFESRSELGSGTGISPPGADSAGRERSGAARPIPARVRLGCSIGIAVIAKGLSPEQVLDRADRALYRAKSQGRNRCVFDET